MQNNMILIVMGIFFSFCFLSSLSFATNSVDPEPIGLMVSSQTYIDTYLSWYFVNISNTTYYAQFKINPDFLADYKVNCTTNCTKFCQRWFNNGNGSDSLDCNNNSIVSKLMLDLNNMSSYPLKNLTANTAFSNFAVNTNTGVGQFYINFSKGLQKNTTLKLGFGTTIVDATASSGDFPCITQDLSGNSFIVERIGSTTVKICNNTAGSWDCTNIDTNGSDLGNGIGCASDNQGIIHVMYRDGGNNTWRYWNTSSRQINYAQILGFTPAYAGLAIDSLNNKHFVFDNYTGSRQLIYCNATAQLNNWGNCTKVDSTSNAGEYPDIATNSTNDPQMTAQRNSASTMLYCNRTAGVFKCIVLTGIRGLYTSIAVRDDQSIVTVASNSTTILEQCNNSLTNRNAWKCYVVNANTTNTYNSVTVDYANNSQIITFNSSGKMRYCNRTFAGINTCQERYIATNLGGQCQGSCITVIKGNIGYFPRSYSDTAGWAYRNSTLNYDNITGLPQPSAVGTAWNATVNDTVTIVEFINSTEILTRSVKETITTVEFINETSVFSRSTTNIITMVEYISSIKGVIRTTSDTITSVEIISETSSYKRLTQETITVVERINKTASFSRSLENILNTVERIISAFGYARNTGDILTGYDSISTSKGYTRTQTDITTILDTRIVTFSATRSKSDAMQIIESINRAFGVSRSYSDIISTTDYITRKLTASDTVKDIITTVENIIKSASYPRNVYNTISIVENISKLQLRFRYIFDTINVITKTDMTTTGFSLINIILTNRDADAFVWFNWSVSGGTAPFSYNATLYKTDNLSRIIYSVITTSNSYKFIGLNGSTNYTVVVNATDATGKTSQLNLTARSEAILVSWEIGIPLGIFAMAFFLIYVAVNLMPKREGLQALFWVSSLFVIYGGIDIMAKIATENGELGIASILNAVNGGYIWIIVLVIAYLLLSFLVEQLRAMGKLK